MAGKKLGSEFRGRGPAEGCEAAMGPEPFEERSEACGLDVVETSATYERCQLERGEPPESLEAEQSVGLEHGYRLLYVGPGRVLGEDRPDRYLKLSVTGPPVLRSERRMQSAIDNGQDFLCLVIPFVSTVAKPHEAQPSRGISPERSFASLAQGDPAGLFGRAGGRECRTQGGVGSVPAMKTS